MRASGGSEAAAALPASPSAQDEQIAREVASFRPFDVLFNQPNTVPYRKQTLIRFVIASKDLEEAQAEFADTQGTVSAGNATLGRQVRAQLSGPEGDVQIQLVGTDQRDISSAANTTFEWYITPKTTGPFKLTLRLYNRVYDGTRWVELQQPPYVKEFEVSVSAAQRLKLLLAEINGWLALVGSSVIALLTLSFKRLRARFTSEKPGKDKAPA
jgi:hypothetical protein